MVTSEEMLGQVLHLFQPDRLKQLLSQLILRGVRPVVGSSEDVESFYDWFVALWFTRIDKIGNPGVPADVKVIYDLSSEPLFDQAVVY